MRLSFSPAPMHLSSWPAALATMGLPPSEVPGSPPTEVPDAPPVETPPVAPQEWPADPPSEDEPATPTEFPPDQPPPEFLAAGQSGQRLMTVDARVAAGSAPSDHILMGPRIIGLPFLLALPYRPVFRPPDTNTR
jgi:hypothetical protein